MEPVGKIPHTVLGVIEEVERVQQIAKCDAEIAIKLRHQVYVHALKAIAGLSQEEFSRDVAVEALTLEELPNGN
jgi:hypothetical protein